MVRLWLDTGGRYMKLSIKRGLTSYFPVEIVQDVWYHVCLSYQSDYGAWALYIDSRVVSCEASQTVSTYSIKHKNNGIPLQHSKPNYRTELNCMKRNAYVCSAQLRVKKTTTRIYQNYYRILIYQLT